MLKAVSKGLLSSLRKWQEWRARQGRAHVGVVATYRSVGTVTARTNQHWTIAEDDGRVVYVSNPEFVDVNIGDRVEIAPAAPGMPVMRPYGWIVLRTVAKAE